MAPKTPRAVQTPGETPAAAPGDAFMANAVTTGADAPPDDLSNDDLRAMLKAQAAQINALHAAVQNVARAQAPARAETEELPDIDSLDKSTITSPVLTKQGWFVPQTYGANPAAPKM